MFTVTQPSPMPLDLGGGWQVEPADGADLQLLRACEIGPDVLRDVRFVTRRAGSPMVAMVYACVDRWAYWSDPTQHQN